MIEELFVKKRIKITKHGESEQKDQTTTETWTAGRATTGTQPNESSESENAEYESSSGDDEPLEPDLKVPIQDNKHRKAS